MDNRASIASTNSNISTSAHSPRIRTSVTPEPSGDSHNGRRSRTPSASSSRKSPIPNKSPRSSHDVAKPIIEEKNLAKPGTIGNRTADIEPGEEPKTNIVEQRRRLFE